jgi:hypothetical protein
METIAVYWEKIIRTYGFTLFEDQALAQIDLPAGQIAQWGKALRTFDGSESLFRLVWAQAGAPDRIKFCLLCDDTHWQLVKSRLDRLLDPGFKTGPWELSRADMISFQGPHFGDRYGILDFTLKALAKEELPLLGIVCSVATIDLVLPAGWGAKTKEKRELK